MNFKHNHSEGPWSWDGLDIVSGKIFIVDGDYIKRAEDIPLIVQASTMRDYMVGRAEKINKNIEYLKKSTCGPSLILSELTEELSLILGILRAAGVEVVE